VARVNGVLPTVVIVTSLALAAWGGLAALLNRPPTRALEIAASVVEACLVFLTGATIAQIIGGERPAEPATFTGYLITTLALLPAGVILARMEPTRWGSAIVGGAALVVPVLVLRLQQTYG
jgi:hypothetical protein